MNDYPDILLELFEDPLLADVRPAPRPLTVDDRIKEKLQQIADFCKSEGRLPLADGSFNEKRLYRSLEAIRRESGQEVNLENLLTME